MTSMAASGYERRHNVSRPYIQSNRPGRENHFAFSVFDDRALGFILVRLASVIGLSEAVVKFQQNARIRHNFTHNTCFYHSDTFFEIGSARPIFADFAAPAPAAPRQIVRIRKRKDLHPTVRGDESLRPIWVSVDAMRVAALIASGGFTGQPIPPT